MEVKDGSGGTAAPASRATMREVAALAGVSIKTVSRVVNGESGVTSDLVDRVERAVKRLGYRHNLTASSLRRLGGKTRTLGLVLHDVANPFSAVLHRAVEDVARSSGVQVYAASSDEDPERERAAIDSFASHRVDGLIVMSASLDQSYLVDERRVGTAIVAVDRPLAFFDADSVISENRVGARAGVAHLIAHGHRRIAFLGYRDGMYTTNRRLDGYREAFAEAGLVGDERLVRLGLLTIDRAEQATRDLLSGPESPTAIFSAMNEITVGVARALSGLGSRGTIAHVGFDDVLLADVLDPAITVVVQDPYAIGSLATRQLFRRIDGDSSPTVRIVVPTCLIVRGSGEIAPWR